MSTLRSKYSQGKVKLERALSKRGLASRTQARALIESGSVKVNGMKRTDPNFLVNPDTAKFEVAGKKSDSFEWHALLLNKPKGVVTTRSDEKNRKTVFDLLSPEEKNQKLHAVGRLDFATTGLLIFTNDTKFSSYLTDPESAIQRTYIVTVRGEVSPESACQAENGVQDEGEVLKAESVEVLKTSNRESQLRVELTEGKNREIRRLFLKLGHEVTALKRIAYGSLVLGDLKSGCTQAVSLEKMKIYFPGAPFRE